MDVVFDTATGALRVDTVGDVSRGAHFRARLDRHGKKTIDIRNVRLELKVTVGGQVRHEVTLPPPHVKYVSTDQDVLAQTTARGRWAPDEEVVVDAALTKTDGRVVTARHTFVAPRPPQPYASWTWDSERWVAPVPYPSEEEGGEGVYYRWDESVVDWAAVEEEATA